MSVTMGSQAGTSGDAESNPHQFDVFINNRGPDVKNTFVAHLHPALKRDGFRPFLDAEDIEHGQHVFESIIEALNGSCVHVAIISKRYAESKYCLDELCLMLESGKDILPVFYHVHPADLRRIENGPFQEGFRKHSEHETEEQILKWKEALLKISAYRGLRLDEVKWNEAELVRGIVEAVRKLMSTVRQGVGAIERTVKQPEPEEALEDGADGGVEQVPPEAEAPEEPTVTFNLGDGRLNILVLGDPESVEAVIGHICGARRQQTPVEDHVNLTESRNSSQTMYLYSHTKGVRDSNFFKDIRNFVKARNRKWRPKKVEALWESEVRECSGRKTQPALFPDNTSRLHVVWFACSTLSDLPNHLEWPEIAEKLCHLPVQILVVEKQRTRELDMSDQQDFNSIVEHRSDFFPNVGNFIMRDLIVKVSFQDDDLKEELLCKCCDVRTRAEIGNVSEIIREIRRRLTSAGKSFQLGVGGATIRKEVSLSRSAKFVLDFLCSYWDIPQNSLRYVLQGSTSFTYSQARGRPISIEPCKFVEFCLKVAAIILYNARNPNISYESRPDQLLLTEARECYNSYFNLGSHPFYYDKMHFEDIRLLLERIFERNGWDPPPVASVDRNSPKSKIAKLIHPH